MTSRLTELIGATAELCRAACGRTALPVTELIQDRLTRFPNITPSSVRQMKDVEFTATLLLFIELGEKSLSQTDLDEAFSERDAEWDARQTTAQAFENVVSFIEKLTKGTKGKELARTRLKNQADFYGLFAAVHELQKNQKLRESRVKRIREELLKFMDQVQTGSERDQNSAVKAYYDAARSASNDAGPRRVRIDTLKDVVARAQRR